MFKWLMKWRRERFPTNMELYLDGKEFARKQFEFLPYELALQTIAANGLDRQDPFERGADDVIIWAQNGEAAGYKTADTIIKGAPRSVAITVIENRAGTNNIHFHRGMMKRLKEELEGDKR